MYAGSGYLMKTSAGARPVRAARVSGGFFRTLGITPALGRDLYSNEDAAETDTVALSYAAWQK